MPNVLKAAWRLVLLLCWCAIIALIAEEPSKSPQIDLRPQLHIAIVERDIAQLQLLRHELIAQMEKQYCLEGQHAEVDSATREWKCVNTAKENSNGSENAPTKP